MVARPSQRPPRLPVVSLDACAADALGGGAQWRVHSVFTNAFNLVSSRADLIGVVVQPAGNAPATLVVSRQDAPERLSAMLERGEEARVSPTAIIVAERLLLDLSTARLWHPAPLTVTLSDDEINARMYRAALVGARCAPPDGLAPLLLDVVAWAAPDDTTADCASGVLPVAGSLTLRTARSLLGRLTEAIETSDWSAVQASAGRLSGLGPGLTPAGDDALAGLALGYRAAHGAMPVSLQEAIERAVNGRTTDLAEARVRHAVSGRSDEATHAVLASILMSETASVDPAVRQLTDYGHSSGADTLVGLLLGARLGLAYRRRTAQAAPQPPFT